jgi:hypothetical protein
MGSRRGRTFGNERRRRERLCVGRAIEVVLRRWDILLKLFPQNQGRLTVAWPTSSSGRARAGRKEKSAPGVEGAVGIPPVTNCERAGRRWQAGRGGLGLRVELD